MTLADPRLAAAAAQLVTARTAGRLQDLDPAHVPASEAEAYGVQDILAKETGVIGWKVSPAAPGKPSRCAPILEGARIAAGDALSNSASAPELEGEIAVVLGQDLVPDGGAFSTERVCAAVDGICLAIEVLDSRFVNRKAVSEFSALADLQSNDGLMVGPLLTEWQALDFSELRPEFTLSDGQLVTSTKPMPGTAAVVEALCWLAAHAAARGLPLRAGQIIITGARSGPFVFPPDSTAELRCPGFAGVSIRRGASQSDH